jgi:hypothetical protein
MKIPQTQGSGSGCRGQVRENLIGGNQASADPDDFLLGTLRSCRLAVLADRGLDGTMGPR